MLEQIVQFLLGIAVTVAGAAGIDTATNAPHGVGPDVDSVAAKVAWAKQQAGERLTANEVDATVETEELHGDGTAAALAALQTVMESAPPAAADGLNQAWESVSNAPVGEPSDPSTAGADAAPVEVPVGPPAELPAGAPDGVPPVDPGRP